MFGMCSKGSQTWIWVGRRKALPQAFLKLDTLLDNLAKRVRIAALFSLAWVNHRSWFFALVATFREDRKILRKGDDAVRWPYQDGPDVMLDLQAEKDAGEYITQTDCLKRSNHSNSY